MISPPPSFPINIHPTHPPNVGEEKFKKKEENDILRFFLSSTIICVEQGLSTASWLRLISP